MDDQSLALLKSNLEDIFLSSDSIAEKVERIERIDIITLHCFKDAITSSQIDIIGEIQEIIYLYTYAPNQTLIFPPTIKFTLSLADIMPVLTEAIDKGYSKTIGILANVSAIEPYHYAPDGKVLLNKFIEQGQIKYARALLNHGAEVNNSGALLEAIKGSYNLDIFEMLLQHKADVHKSSSGSPLSYAFRYNNTQAMQWLISKGADAGALVDGETILKSCPHKPFGLDHRDTNRCDTNIIRILIDNGAKMEPYKNLSPLLFFITHGHSEAVAFLLECNADPKASYYGGYTPLKAAMSASDFGTMETLLKFGVTLNYPATKLETQLPLHYAVSVNKVDCVQWLLGRNADPAALDFNGTTPAQTICLRLHYNEGKAKALEIQKLLADAINAQSRVFAVEENAAAGGENEPCASANCFIEEESACLGAQVPGEQE